MKSHTEVESSNANTTMLRTCSHLRPKQKVPGFSIIWNILPPASNRRCHAIRRHFPSKVCDHRDNVAGAKSGHTHSTRRMQNASSRNVSSGAGDSRSKSLATPPFQDLVRALQSAGQTCTILESSCGGLIASSLMAVPGSSRVFFGSTVAYSTKKSGPLLCGGAELHDLLLAASNPDRFDGDFDVRPDLSEETKAYVRTKINWTRDAALSYCERMQTDFAMAEGGATGPTFHPRGMESGFTVLAVAGRRRKGGSVEILAQKVVYSPHADRQLNMRLYADAAADLCLEAMLVANPSLSESQIPKAANISDYIDKTEDVTLDRSSHLRSNASVMKDLYRREDAQHVILRGTDEALFASSTKLELPTLSSLNDDATLIALIQSSGTHSDELLKKRTFLGRLGASRTPAFALFLPETSIFDGNSSYQNCYFEKTRPRAPFLTPTHNELALTATAYANWRKAHRFCNVSGSPLEYIHGGTCAKGVGSDGEAYLHWPRQDPSIITLVTNPSSTHALLARSPRHSPYFYTALAGFVEAGETFESAIVREVHEEVGVAIDRQSVNYIASQPWPFPRSCMIGMTARTQDGLSPISIDPNEIVDAQWFEKEVVYQAARDSDMMGVVMDPKVVADKQAKGEWNGKLLVPSKGVLARTLVDHWLEHG